MSFEIQEWDSQEEFEAWLREFPMSHSNVDGIRLYEEYKAGLHEDDDEVWSWAQFWWHEREARKTRGELGDAEMLEELRQRLLIQGERFFPLAIRSDGESREASQRICAEFGFDTLTEQTELLEILGRVIDSLASKEDDSAD